MQHTKSSGFEPGLTALLIALIFLLSAGYLLSEPELVLPFSEPSAGQDRNRFSFLVYGDIQGSYRDGHRRLLESMQREPADFMLNVGDISKGRSYRRFLLEIEQLSQRVPFFPAVGNHDIQWHSESGRERFRAVFAKPYSWLATQKHNDHLTGDNQRLWYSFRYADSLFIVLDSNLFIDSGYYRRTHKLPAFSGYAEDQLKWLRFVLKESIQDQSIRTRFVFMHHSPFFSQRNTAFLGLLGGHENDSEFLINQQLPDGIAEARYLLDLFRVYRVNAIFSGHQHYYERWVETIRERDRTVHASHWVVVGSGGVRPRAHREYGDARVDRLFQDGKLYHTYLQRITQLDPDWSSEMKRLYPTPEHRSGKFQNYIRVDVDGKEVRFKTVDADGNLRDSGFISRPEALPGG
jgi:3',5'-cyclic AMP phosphodiesterase CpdA